MESNSQMEVPATEESALAIEDNETAILNNTIKWSRFFVISIWVLTVLVILILLFFALAGYNLLHKVSAGDTTVILAWATYTTINIVMSVFLFRFCILCRKAIHDQNVLTFNKALAALKYYFIISGAIVLSYLLYTLVSYVRHGR